MPNLRSIANGRSGSARRSAAYNTRMGRSRWLTRIAVAVLLVALGAAAVSAQRRGRGRFFEPIKSPTPDTFQGSFNFCRVMFSQGYDGRGGNWAVDYPRADVNLSIRLSELTKTRVSTDASGEPDHIVISLTDPALFECPFIMMTEVGNAYISPEEAVKLREYLQKGGFLWADDFWGSYAWENWEHELGKVLPPNDYKVFELPKDHPLFRQQFQISKVIQIASINYWMGSGGDTSEQGPDSAVARRDGRRRCAGAPDGAHDAQHGLRRFVGARSATTRTTSTASRSTATPLASTPSSTRCRIRIADSRRGLTTGSHALLVRAITRCL